LPKTSLFGGVLSRPFRGRKSHDNTDSPGSIVLNGSNPNRRNISASWGLNANSATIAELRFRHRVQDALRVLASFCARLGQTFELGPERECPDQIAGAHDAHELLFRGKR